MKNIKWDRPDLNRRPQAPKARILTKLDHDPDVNAQKRPQFKLLIPYDDFK